MDVALSKFHNSRILIIGDLMLDKYIIGSVGRISPEAPVQVVDVRSEKYIPGGAANVANNVASLGGKSDIFGIIGKDHSGEILMSELKKRGISTSGIVLGKGFQTTQKIRIIAQHQQLMRIDYEMPIIDGVAFSSSKIEYLVKACDIVVISDYAKGVVTQGLFALVEKFCSKYSKKLIIDPKPPHKFYKGAYLLTPNKKEAEELSGMKYENDIMDIGNKLVELFDSNVIITLGDQGMALFEIGQKPFIIPASAKEVYDVSGAGDTVVAALALSIACGASLRESCIIANHAAGIVVGKLGTATISLEELDNALNRL